MNILTIPLRNSLRKRFRTLLLVLVFGLGVAAVVALNHVSRAVGEGLEEILLARETAVSQERGKSFDRALAGMDSTGYIQTALAGC